MFVEAYGKVALSGNSYREGSCMLKNGEFNVDDKERSGKSKVFENREILHYESFKHNELFTRALHRTQFKRLSRSLKKNTSIATPELRSKHI